LDEILVQPLSLEVHRLTSAMELMLGGFRQKFIVVAELLG
jgi:hypothetical protein